MTKKFAIFILTHGRSGNCLTYRTLKKTNCAHKIYFLIDNEDEQKEQYIKNFGAENVIVFDKSKSIETTDTMCNVIAHDVIVYARNECQKISAKLGLDYFLQLDDDYVDFQYRFVDSKSRKLQARKMLKLNELVEAAINYLETAPVSVLALPQGGDMMGGTNGGYIQKTYGRKAMNCMFFRVSEPIEYKGLLNEDVVTYTTLGSVGKIFLTAGNAMIVQKETQSLDGGCSLMYSGGTYSKSFYAVMSMPSAVKIQELKTKKSKRIHHKVYYNNCVPKIITEEFKK